ncbi:MAG TPA: hypothetical protein DEB59_02310 [Acidimicrobiaceae bacterium]|mgnify:FL=1|jgi:PPOX class probable FMN-dependent enzyme|nr:pyridoxamine 5'-phosphate oxidase family protein [Actinomycetota bacterium]MEC9088637.1 pyridoxamine 5'-phosphate oxidase family protein [Actinomycetota bacterium]HBU39273.1 hypothetical protein [Acidimicrobiaceae bacterium]|tara:strand:- start:49241 stop:49861 length:621 start_codon:yes stop_codon:yes gene_type:complete
MTSSNLITDITQLDALYGDASPRSLTKEIDALNSQYQSFIEASPFMAVATVGMEGLDCSPRGEQGSVVRVVDANTIQFADRRGNNRLDTLRNIVEDDRIALLFLVPGIGETMRVNGRATISIAPELIEAFTVDGKSPKTVVEVKVERVYFQCSKALVRSGIWDSDIARSFGDVPSAGEMLAATTNDSFDALEYDRMLEKRYSDELW